MNSKFDSIADGLADRGFAVVDDFLSSEEVNEILLSDEFKDTTKRFKKAGVGKQQGLQINEAVRGDYIQWLDKVTAPAPIQVYLNRLDKLIQFLNQNLYLSLKDYEVHMTSYPIGSFYKRHLDQFRVDDHRKLSVICYLNTQWKEEHNGKLRMFLGDEVLDVLPVSGRLVCFRSDQIEHEVLPALRERLSITGWMIDKIKD